MAKSWTYSEIKTKVENDLDLTAETFVTPAELLGYANEAIDEAEQEIHTIYEDYFLTSENISIVAGTADYDLPADIYAHKIRQFFFNDNPGQPGGKKYSIKRIKSLPDVNLVQDTEKIFRYALVNSLSGGPKIRLYPTPTETSATNFTLWFIRNAREITADADVVDVPEAAKFIIQHMKKRIYEKEGNPNVIGAIADLERERRLLVSTLSAMIPDEDNEMLLDTSFYNDFDYALYGDRDY